MKLGKYKKKQIDFTKWQNLSLTLHFDLTSYALHYGCGPCALSLLTGIPVSIISKQNRFLSSTSDAFVVNFLRRNGFSVLELDAAKITNFEQITNKFTERNVFLVSQLFSRQQGSWAVIMGEYHIHNYSIEILSSKEFLERPVLTAYLIKAKKDWVKKIKKRT